VQGARLSIVGCKGICCAIMVEEAGVGEIGGDVGASDLGTYGCKKSKRGDSEICHVVSWRAHGLQSGCKCIRESRIMGTLE